MAGAILLLVAGTQIMEWYWMAVVFGASFLLGLARTLRRSPQLYSLAQQVDARLGLHDCLSSAFFFGRPPGDCRGNPECRLALLGRAESLCREIPVVQAAPLRAPRAIYAASILAMIALGMFGVRYGIHRSLDLRRPLSQSLIEIFRPSARFAAANKPGSRKLPPELEQMALAADPAPSDKTGDGTPASAYTPEGADPIDTVQMEQPAGQDPAAGENSEGEDGTGSGEDSVPGDDPAAPDGKQQPDANQDPTRSGENSSLLDKMRDALANLMAKLKMQPPKTGEGRQASKQKGGQQAGADPRQGQKGMPNDGKQAQGNPSPDSKGEQAPGGEQSQTAQGRTADQAGDQQASEDSKSGIGKQDGSKDIREAEQLAAMGKISEILGKRQQNLTGEIMVEVPSGNQRLKTAYTSREGGHSDSGGEIHRDEVPLLYQQYVQRYFEEIRKAAPLDR